MKIVTTSGRKNATKKKIKEANNKEEIKMYLRQQAPTPDECVKPENECKTCRFFQHCREIVKKKCGDLSSVAIEAQRNSLGSLAYEEKGFTSD